MIDLAQHAAPVASLSGPIVDFCVNVINDTGLAGVFFLMLVHSAGLPVPSEAVMLFAGFNVSTGDQSMLGIIVAGMAGQMAGSWALYAVGYYGRVELLEKNRLIHVGGERLAATDRWFARHGDAAVFWTRMVPVVRALGSLPWIVGLAVLGDAVGNNWDKWRDHLQYLDYAATVLLVGLIVYLLVRRGRGGRGDEKPEPEPARAGGS